MKQYARKASQLFGRTPNLEYCVIICLSELAVGAVRHHDADGVHPSSFGHLDALPCRHVVHVSVVKMGFQLVLDILIQLIEADVRE